MDFEEAIVFIGVILVAIFLGAGIHALLSDDFAQDFCQRQGHFGVERSDAEPPTPYIICYDNVPVQGRDVKQLVKYELNTYTMTNYGINGRS